MDKSKPPVETEIVSYIFLLILSCAANGVFSVIIVQKRNVLSVTAIILASLFITGIVSSIFFGVFIILHFYLVITADHNIPMNYIITVFMYSSTFHLFASAFERYIAIVHPMRHEQLFTGKRIVVTIVLCWLMPCVVAALTILSVTAFHIHLKMNLEEFCVFMKVNLSLVIACYFLVALLYARIYFIARRQRGRIAALSERTNHVTIRPIVILFVTASYGFVLWTFDFIVLLLTCNGITFLNMNTRILLHVPLIINCLHPVIYGIGDKILRSALIGVCRRHHSIQVESTTQRWKSNPSPYPDGENRSY